MRLKHGAVNLCGAFYELSMKNPKLTASRLNDPTLTFTSLYILIPHIKGSRLVPLLNERTRYAMQFCGREHRKTKSPMEKSTLKWIFVTGSLDDGLCNDFDELIDISCQKLILAHRDTSVIPNAIDLMFKRNRKNGHVHDLAWCVCENASITAMELISEYLRSDLEADNLLAYRLLNFKPDLQPVNKEQQYKNFHAWLRENKKYLYNAHQSFNQSSNPKPWRVMLPAKYLSQSSMSKVEPRHQRAFESFVALSEEEQKLLAKYSFKLRHNDMAVWNSFVSLPIEHQLGTARMAEGGAYYL